MYNNILPFSDFSLRRYHCFLKNLEKTKQVKRPYIPLIDGSKESIRVLQANQIKQSISYVNYLYYNKYNRTLELT